MSNRKVKVAPTASALQKRHIAAVADLFTTWLDMADAALVAPDVSPSAAHVRLAIAATAGIPVVCWLQSDNTVGWKIPMPIVIKKATDGKSWEVLFIDSKLEAEEKARQQGEEPIKIDLDKPNIA